MSTSLESLGIDQLSVPERLELIDKIWQSLRETPPAELLTEGQRREIERRLDKYADDPDAGSPWDEVKARFKARR